MHKVLRLAVNIRSARVGGIYMDKKGICHKHILINKYFNLIEKVLLVPDFIIIYLIMIKMKFYL